MTTFGILLFDGVEELDAVGPWEVLAYWASEFPDDGATVTTIAVRDRRVRCAKNLVIEAEHQIGHEPALDVLIHPGGRGTRPLAHDEQHLDWLRARRADVTVLASVCTGSLVYAAAGLLAGRPATTYHTAFDDLLGFDGTIRPDREARWVDDGDVVTAAGVSAGIDMALHLVRRFAGEQRARGVRRGIQYDPQPPV